MANLSRDLTRAQDSARRAARTSAVGTARRNAPQGWREPNDLPGPKGIGGKTGDSVFKAGTRRVPGFNTTAEAWKVLILREGVVILDVTDRVTTLSWTEPSDSAIWTGTVTWIEPKRPAPLPTLPLLTGARARSGDEIVLRRALTKGGFQEVFRMRLSDPSATAGTGERTFSFANELTNLQESVEDFKFKKAKKGPKRKGWRVDEAVRFILERFGIDLAPKGFMCEARITNKLYLTSGGDVLSIINDLFRIERVRKGRRLVMRLVSIDGKPTLYVTPLRRSKVLLGMADSIIEAVLSEQRYASESQLFATAVTVRANPIEPKGTSTRVIFKINALVESSAAIRRWGYVHRVVYVHGGAKSVAEAKELGKRYLAKVATVRETISVTHPGMVNLHKGDAIKMYLKDFGISKIVWVAEVTHSVDSTGHSMSVTCVFDDVMANVKPGKVDENEIQNTGVKKRNAGKKKPTTAKQAAVNLNREDVPKKTAGDALIKAASKG